MGVEFGKELITRVLSIRTTLGCSPNVGVYSRVTSKHTVNQCVPAPVGSAFEMAVRRIWSPAFAFVAKRCIVFGNFSLHHISVSDDGKVSDGTESGWGREVSRAETLLEKERRRAHMCGLHWVAPLREVKGCSLEDLKYPCDRALAKQPNPSRHAEHSTVE